MRSTLNADVPLARPGEFGPLCIGPLRVDPPVVLAPMAGVTNAPFRTVCRRFSGNRCLYVSEMITAKAFALGNAKTMRLASFAPEETVRSIQLYGTDPVALGEATRVLRDEWDVHHIDMNFGCPVRKVTAAGGGAAIPARPRLMARLVQAVVRNAGSIPVTVKFRKGIDRDLLTFRDAGRVGEEEGCRAVALHARTAAQLYSGNADWNAIAELKQAVRTIPVLGNGDVFEAFDALRMLRQTGCDGVVVGRGCLGRPWLFRDLCDVFDGNEPQAPPKLGEIVDVTLEHARLLAAFFGERPAMLQMRKFCGWYTKSFPGVKRAHAAMQRLETLADLESVMRALPPEQEFPEAALRVRRCKDGREQKVSLPHGFLEAGDDELPIDDPLDAGLIDGG
ncbi:MAG: tRNA dihydrouridine synthase DusB [Planctomycetota bacterium]